MQQIKQPIGPRTGAYVCRAMSFLFALMMAGATACADDADIRQRGNQWTLRTSRMERVVVLEDGRLVLKRFTDRITGRELVASDAVTEEFLAPLADEAELQKGSSGGWRLLGSKQSKLPQGEQQLDITVQRDALQVTKSYVLYPGSSIVHEWVTFKNAGTVPLPIREPCFLNLTVQPGAGQPPEFSWMSGGDNQPGSWNLKTESLNPVKPRGFDSYEPFPAAMLGAQHFPGDGIDATVLLNGQQVWPDTNWQHVANATVRVPFEFTADVQPGDQLVFLVNMHGNIGYDTTAFDPTIAYADGSPRGISRPAPGGVPVAPIPQGETHTASKEFSGEQGKNGWRYQYLENGRFIDLVYYPGPKQWRKEKDNITGTPFVGVGDQHPDNGQDAARVWTAPKAGPVRVTGSICNTGNGVGIDTRHGFRPGSASYAPWYALYAQDTKQGVFIGWDYFGHWTSSFALHPNGSVTAQLGVAGYRQTLAPGESVTTPRAFVGLYRDDLDNAGNECLDWQYRYLWDYTRDGWFPAIRMLGYWMNGTGWGQPGNSWTGGGPDFQSTFRKVFRVADLMSYVGADVYHRDWGWWDRAGDWNGPDFRTTINYLRKHDMGQLIYAFLYTVDKKSRVAQEHSDWLLGETLDMSRPEVVAFMQNQLDQFVARWGDFEWRNDSFFTAQREGSDRAMLAQDEGFRRLIRTFLDRHPQCAFQAVNGGGNYGGYDYTRYASAFSFSDGAVGPLRNYYAALLFPPDKTSDIPDIWKPNDYNKATWRGLLCINFDMTGDTTDPAKLEGLRELVDIYHYLHQQGVVGRWVRVFRPLITGDDPTMYFQRLSRDGQRGVIIPKRPAPGSVTIRPKGLLPQQTYFVSFQESDRSERRTGTDLMQRGISFDKMPAGELIYLNLPLHPGSKVDTKSPTTPHAVIKRPAENMGYPGVELSWKAGADDNWVSYYEIFRGGVALDKVAKGTFYFDHSAGADQAARYEVRTVDGSGNVSARVAAKGPAARPAQVFDDAPGDGIKFSGEWQHENHLFLTHDHTLSSSDQKGARAELSFNGRSVLVFSQLGANCGKVAVSIDGGTPEVVDTYSADDIWGVCVFRKELATAGPHTLRLEVLGEHSARAKDHVFHLDGVRVETD
ncbi:MAG: alpha-amylase family protein [Limisphaerales bacterium]